MKIAIFGDSFGHSYDLPEFKKYNDAVSWADILSKKYTVVNFSMSGSGVYFSFREFKKYHSEYDKIIFLVSVPGRVLLPEHMKLELNTLDNGNVVHGMRRHVANVNQAEMVLNLVEQEKGSLMDKKRLSAIKDYFLWVMSLEEQSAYAYLMAKEVQSIRPDALVQQTSGRRGNDLWTISITELEHWGETQETINQKNLFEIRPNHLTKENNIILANKMEQWILHGTPLNLSPNEFVKPVEPLENYFVKQIEKPE